MKGVNNHVVIQTKHAVPPTHDPLGPHTTHEAHTTVSIAAHRKVRWSNAPGSPTRCSRISFARRSTATAPAMLVPTSRSAMESAQRNSEFRGIRQSQRQCRDSHSGATEETFRNFHETYEAPSIAANANPACRGTTCRGSGFSTCRTRALSSHSQPGR